MELKDETIFQKNLCFEFVPDDENCPECDDILEELEHIDGDADQYGKIYNNINMQEPNVEFAEKKDSIHGAPILVARVEI